VGVVRLEGTIARGRSRSDPFGAVGIAGADTVAELLRRAAADRDVAAIVLRIESPGGDGLASDLVWRAVMQARRAGKPVIASMGDVAASGGYLAAVAADTLIAEPSTLTGSIGVFALKPDLSGLLAGIGVRRVTLRRGEHADLRSFTRPWTLEERSLVEGQVKAFYDVFLARVASGRRMTTDQVHPLAQGRVWTGAQALERGLVDRVGSFADAVELAKERAGLAGDDSVELRAFEPDRSFLRELAGGLAAEETPSVVAMLASIPELRTAALLLELGPLLALPPEWVGVEVPPTAGPVPGGAAPGDGAR
jgi:protease-4